MQDLTNDQFNSLKTLSKNPFINQVSIDMHSNNLLRVTVVSTDDADFNLIDMLLEDAFPHKEYRGSDGEDVDGDYYSIDVDGETLINLVMKRAPTSIEAEEKVIHPDYMINVTKPQSSLKPWLVEQIFEERGVRK